MFVKNERSSTRNVSGIMKPFSVKREKLRYYPYLSKAVTPSLRDHRYVYLHQICKSIISISTTFKNTPGMLSIKCQLKLILQLEKSCSNVWRYSYLEADLFPTYRRTTRKIAPWNYFFALQKLIILSKCQLWRITIWWAYLNHLPNTEQL